MGSSVLPDATLGWVASTEVLRKRRFVLLGFLIWFLVEFQWNALRALPTASLCLSLELSALWQWGPMEFSCPVEATA